MDLESTLDHIRSMLVMNRFDIAGEQVRHINHANCEPKQGCSQTRHLSCVICDVLDLIEKAIPRS